MQQHCSLFVFSINGPKQNARSLLTAVSDPAFYALSHGSKHFVLHGSSNNRLHQGFWLAVEEFWPIRRWLKKLPWRAKPMLPCERAWKAGSETGVKNDLAFCLGSLFKKTNSEETNRLFVTLKIFTSPYKYLHVSMRLPWRSFLWEQSLLLS